MLTSELPKFLALRPALTAFATTADTQGQQHIKPLHQYVALRLVLEGGFLPEDITPNPPLRASRVAGRHVLHWAADAETAQEQTIIGGLKSKDVDVVVCKPKVGPVLAVSLKGTSKAFRNLTNRMEEAIGDCTNIHLMYPGLVYGFFSLIRANEEGDDGIAPNDVCIRSDGAIVEVIERYHDVLRGLTGRDHVRDDPSRYEAAALALVGSFGDGVGSLRNDFPPADSVLALPLFFGRLLRIYDVRYPYMATRMGAVARVCWDSESPAIESIRRRIGEQVSALLGYEVRTA